jgi:hypothetical protein
VKVVIIRSDGTGILAEQEPDADVEVQLRDISLEMLVDYDKTYSELDGVVQHKASKEVTLTIKAKFNVDTIRRSRGD